MAPRVSVLMPVYNGAQDVPRAVESILSQTYTDFELIALDDGSPRDNSWEVLCELKQRANDPRFTVVRLERNIGLAGALNHLIGLSRGTYLARQDQDDISDPRRLEAQVDFLDAHPRCGLLGTRAEIWVEDRASDRFHDHALTNGALQFDLISNNPFVHSSVMMRRSALEAVGLYSTDRERQPPEDYELWSRMARQFEIANLPERLLIYREVQTSMSREGPNPFADKLIRITSENLAWWAGMSKPNEVCKAAAALLHAAPDRMSHDASIETICALATAAADGVIAACPEEGLELRRDALVANLRHHYTLARGLPNWSRPVVAAVRRHRLLRAVARRVFALFNRR